MGMRDRGDQSTKKAGWNCCAGEVVHIRGYRPPTGGLEDRVADLGEDYTTDHRGGARAPKKVVLASS
jgi:hypothetical protein